MSKSRSLIGAGEFVRRHLGPTEVENKALLKTVGAQSLQSFMGEVVPAALRFEKEWEAEEGLSEADFLSLVEQQLEKNELFRSYLGLGYYNTIVPSPLLRNLFENPGWYTQYTPYQPEISQGRLESLLNFQTMVCDLTGMEFANASLLDEATAAAEALTLLHRVGRRGEKRNKFFVSREIFPQTLGVLRTRAYWMGLELEVGAVENFSYGTDFFGMLLQYPAEDGSVKELAEVVQQAHQRGIKVAVASDLLALTLLTPPGEWGADVVLGSSQRFGVPLGFGGPHAAFFAVRDAFKRSLPGRIIGISKDVKGNLAYRMSLQSREQHIRREKATSNICTSQALLANLAAMYAVYHGPKGLRQIALRVHGLTSWLASRLEAFSLRRQNAHFFDTLTYLISDPRVREKIHQQAQAAKINFRRYQTLEGEELGIGISLDETTGPKEVEDIVAVFSAALGPQKTEASAAPVEFEGSSEKFCFPKSLIRKSEYLTHPVFNTHQSETQLMRYLRQLEEKDLSLLNAMIPLGSCTMKLNAATQMRPVSHVKAAGLHPFIPLSQAQGYLEIFDQLTEAIKEITGFPALSLQPNSGAQGEYAGLLTIRCYQAAQGEGHREVALIPVSAHGTNPASAVMAGLKVVLVACDEEGNISFEDLKQKAEQHSQQLSCLMITYPSTHGVFEEGVQQITNLIHSHGGQVYLDGANLNAQVGYTTPDLIGADVCHLNLHKTFAIPHGGGGPGMGPIACRAHLAPYLPKHFFSMKGREEKNQVSAAHWGSASILLISYAYIKLLGKRGMREATAQAILNANYLKQKLSPYYPVLYTGRKGHIAHELILDVRPFEKSAGVKVEDVAKRLIDYGFHAPTMSWPVAGTMMLEPTESEDKAELDRLVEALIAIREEIQEIEEGRQPRDNNVLKNAPHPISEVCRDEWNYPYSRTQAAYPLASLRQRKFWPTVSRVDSAYGDRNLVCSCAPVAVYEEKAVSV